MNWKNIIIKRIHCITFLVLLSCLFSETISQNIDDDHTSSLPTVTVRGFLNFKTTVDGTVIVFTPISEMHPPSVALKITTTSSEVLHSSASATEEKLLNSNENLDAGIEDMPFASPPQNSIEPLKTHIPSVNMLESKMEESFLPHISDNAVLPPHSYPTNNDKFKKQTYSSNQFPTGLVTVLGGTSVDGSSTTVHETKVIGTYIDGKYAQILQSTSRVLPKSEYELITPRVISYSTVERSYSASPALNVDLSSVAVILTAKTDNNPFLLKHTPAVEDIISSSVIALSSQVLMTSSSFETLPNSAVSPVIKSVMTEPQSIMSSISKTSTTFSNQLSSTPSITPLLKSEIASNTDSEVVSSPTMSLPSSKIEIKSETKSLQSSILLQSSFDTISSSSSIVPTETPEIPKKSTFTRIKPSLRPVASTSGTLAEDDNMVPSTVKNYRNSTTSRTRFLSPRRPSQTVRLNRFKVKLTHRQDSHDDESITLPADDEDMDEEQIHRGDDDMESFTEPTIPIDPAKVVFTETTITSKVTLFVGRRKSIRILTITTSVPLTVNPTDIQDMFTSEPSLDDEDTESDPYHHVETRTFTTTERALKTSIVPVFDGKSTSYHKVTESFFIMKYITAYRTLPTGDVTFLDPVFDEPEATTLDAAANIQPSITQSAPPPEQFSTLQPSIALPPTGIANPQLSNPFLSLGHALSNNPLAAVYLGLQQLNAQMTLYSTITDTSTYVTTETFYSTKTVRFYDGRTNKFRTVSEPTSTKKVTLTTTVTSIQPYLNTQALQQQQHLQKFMAPTRQEPQFNTITSTYTTVSTATSLSTRIYTLIYNGFSTKFRTVTSTSTYPTTVVVTSTTKVPLVPTQAPFMYPYSA